MKKVLIKVFDSVVGAGPWKSMIGLCLLSFAMLFLMVGRIHAAAAAAPGLPSTTIDRYVIAISANNGGKGRPVLRYAESDAKSFAAVLKDMGGVSQKNVYLIQEPSVAFLNAHFDNVDKILAKGKGKSGREEVLVYYSGHADEKGLHLGEETYSWQEFRKRVDALNADVKIAVIDACGSGAITRAKGGVAVPAFMVDQSSDMKGYAFITSSTQDEASQESDKLRGSFFTHSLVSGLRGAGDLSGDGKVTLSEAYQFAFNETLQKTETTMGGAQHPSRDMNLTGTGDVVMTDLRSTSAGMILDEGIEGRVFIRDASNELVAELYKKSGRSMSLGLPAGKYTVRLERNADLNETNVELTNGKQQKVTVRDFKAVSAEKTVARGEIKSSVVDENMEARFDSLDHNSRFRTTFNAADKAHEPRKGLMMGVFLSMSDDIMIGAQASLIGNLAKNDMHGMQVSPIFNIGKKNFQGLQLSGGFNYAGHMDGPQIGPVNVITNTSPNAVQVGAVNVARSARVQVSSINIARDTVSATQVGAINIVGTTNVQVSAINVAMDAHVQVSAINVAKKVDDTQIAVINVAGKATGRQWGVINVVGHAEKTPIGLINIVGNGVWSFTGSINEMNAPAMSVHFGTAYLFTALEFSRALQKGFDEFEDVYENGIGLGTQFGQYGTHLELEYMFLHVTDKYGEDREEEDYKGNFHHRIRLGGTARLIQGIGLSAGATLNLATEGYGERILVEPKGKWHDDWNYHGHKAKFWPGMYAGITFGRF